MRPRGTDAGPMTDNTGHGEHSNAASPAKVEDVAAEFDAQGQPYARVTVVRREPPVSANVGDRALVTPDGETVGWVGGADCARSVVEDVATDALADGEPVLVGLAPDPEDVDRPGLEAYPMTCHSGGTLEVFVEPVTPVPRLVVVGDSPIARALVEMADRLTYEITVVAETHEEVPPFEGADRTVAATDPETVATAIEGAEYVVVASMGEYDELGVLAGLRAGATYVGLVASDERRDELAATVGERLGLDTETVVDAVTTAAGLDIGAQTAEEIAVSILAELISLRRDAEGPVALDAANASVDIDAASATSQEDGDDIAVDPVCGMEVTVGEAAARVEHGGETYHFCGQGCADGFKDDPGRYLDTEVAPNG